MDKASMLTLFDHGYWATRRVLSAAEGAGSELWTAPVGATVRGLRDTLVHQLDVEWSWRLRLQGEPKEAWQRELSPDDYASASVLAEAWRQDETEMRDWLEGLPDAAFQEVHDLGEGEVVPLWMFLMHLVAHGIQQRADAATMLSAAGHSPGDLEFLDYALASSHAG
jgi:uncharacterized damage-inducible protein DinB